jgi:hypothetical protein
MRHISTIAALATCLSLQPAYGQGDVIGSGNFSHVVANLDKSIEFYRDVLGLELADRRAESDRSTASAWIHAGSGIDRV